MFTCFQRWALDVQYVENKKENLSSHRFTSLFGFNQNLRLFGFSIFLKMHLAVKRTLLDKKMMLFVIAC